MSDILHFWCSRKHDPCFEMECGGTTVESQVFEVCGVGDVF